MPGVYFEDLTVGRVFEHGLRRTVTETDNLLVTTLTMNPAALHLDEQYCRDQTQWGQRIVNSVFTLGLVVGISVHDTTLGTTVANLGWDDVRFPRPVFHGDTIHVRSEVLSQREPFASERRRRRVRARGLQPARRGGDELQAHRADDQAAARRGAALNGRRGG